MKYFMFMQLSIILTQKMLLLLGHMKKTLSCRNLATDDVKTPVMKICRYGELQTSYKGGVRKQTDSPSITNKDFHTSPQFFLQMHFQG